MDVEGSGRFRRPLTRRRFLAGTAAGLGALAVACGGGRPAPHPSRRSSRAVAATGSHEPEFPTAGWLMAENRRPGSLGWIVTGRPVPHAMEGFADRVSAAPGDAVRLFVNTRSPTFHVEAYRMGWYRGLGGRLIWQSQETPGRVQPPSTLTPGVNTVECAWAPSLTVPVTAAWPPGNYLLKLAGSDGQQQYVPLTVRDDNSRAAVVILNAVTTWQAYNLWDGYSLYYGRSGAGQSFANRARVVSFDRPYGLATADWANGAGDWLGNEFPFLMWAERNGLDAAYWTDLDLHADPGKLAAHKALVSLGHDEYWSLAMFDGALAARDAGVNFAFLGANAVFRHIRLQAGPTGANRRVVCYKDAAEDPLNGVDDADVTVNWPEPPVNRPESALIGDMYQSNPVDAPLVAADPEAWGLAGTGMAAGDQLPHVVGSEFDSYQPGGSAPSNLEIWCHSPLVCRGEPAHSDATYYTSPGGGGVFATGTNWWVSKMADNQGLFNPALVPAAIPGVTSVLQQIARNVLTVLGSGPAHTLRPSAPNWSQFYPNGQGAGLPGGVQSS